jgi:hypothetical protein
MHILAQCKTRSSVIERSNKICVASTSHTVISHHCVSSSDVTLRGTFFYLPTGFAASSDEQTRPRPPALSHCAVLTVLCVLFPAVLDKRARGGGGGAHRGAKFAVLSSPRSKNVSPHLTEQRQGRTQKFAPRYSDL